jgi:hypothetical protein
MQHADGIVNINTSNIKVVDQRTKESLLVAYWQIEKGCKTNCVSKVKDDNDDYKCFQTNWESDEKLGLPDSWYACWVKATIPEYTSEFLFNRHDKSLGAFKNIHNCNFLCRTIYGKFANCASVEGKFECYWRE